MTSTATATVSYSVTDVENVVRRFLADIVMIATSSRSISEGVAREYAHDVQVLATGGYLAKVDVTLLSGSLEVRAATYLLNTSAGDLTMSRPGGVQWPQVTNAYLRIVLYYSGSYTSAAREQVKPKLKQTWTSTDANTSHSGLAPTGGRDYASNGFGMQRKDYGA
jgi:hypothetical protein